MQFSEEHGILFKKEMQSMNDHINANGQIKKSSAIIKHWHELTNRDWLIILLIAKELDNEGSIYLSEGVLNDIDRLINHIDNYDVHCNNLLYPSIDVSKKLNHSLSNFSRDTTVKTITFKTMMNIREAYCKMKNLDLPNDDSSKGKLDPNPREELFE